MPAQQRPARPTTTIMTHTRAQRARRLFWNSSTRGRGQGNAFSPHRATEKAEATCKKQRYVMPHIRDNGGARSFADLRSK